MLTFSTNSSVPLTVSLLARIQTALLTGGASSNVALSTAITQSYNDMETWEEFAAFSQQ